LSGQADKIVADRALTSQKTTALASLAGLKKDMVQAEVYKRAMDKMLVTQDQLIDFPRWLDSLARARQVVFNFSFVGDSVKPQGNSPGYIGFNLDAEGRFDNLTAFMKDVELKAPGFLVSLDSIGLNVSGSGYRISSGGKVFFR